MDIDITSYAKRYNRVPLPDIDDFTVKYYYSKGKLKAVKRGRDSFEIVDDKEIPIDNCHKFISYCIVETSRDDDGFKQARKEFNNKRADIKDEFKQEVFKSIGITSETHQEILTKYILEHFDVDVSEFRRFYDELTDLDYLIKDIKSSYQ